MEYKSFEEMPVWQKAMDLAIKIHSLTEGLPRAEEFGLTCQIRSSGLSVSGNIAEGFGRKHTKDKLNFYFHARGSLAETKSHLVYGHKVGYFNQAEYEEYSNLVGEVWKELNALISSLSRKV